MVIVIVPTKLELYLLVHVITTAPGFIAYIIPYLFTVAILLLLDNQL